jgi:hypothetical protein
MESKMGMMRVSSCGIYMQYNPIRTSKLATTKMQNGHKVYLQK